MEIVYVYTKKRSEFGRQPLFSDKVSEICADIQPDPLLKEQFIYKDPVHMAVQFAPEMSEHEVRNIPCGTNSNMNIGLFVVLQLWFLFYVYECRLTQ